MASLDSYDDWVESYRNLRPLYEAFCDNLHVLIEELISAESLRFQIVEARAKTIESFRNKLQHVGKNYKDPLNEITDLSGLRIIVYYNDDIDKICNLLEREFDIDETKSTDNRKILAHDQFGYVSVHKIISLNEGRKNLPEWNACKNLKAEIQIRTVLQHAWAVISHTLQYKNEAAVPYQLRRKLNRLSGLLELADEEFYELRENHEKIADEVSIKFEEKDLAIDIDMISINEFLSNSEVANSYNKLVESLGYEDVDEEFFPDNRQIELPGICNVFGIKKIIDLERDLTSFLPNAESFFRSFYKENRHGDLDHWLSVILVAGNVNKAEKQFFINNLSWDDDYIDELYKLANSIYKIFN